MDGTRAPFTSQKVIDLSGEQISLGGEEKYEPLCRRHYLEHNKGQKT
jgi:thymidine kinase